MRIDVRGLIGSPGEQRELKFDLDLPEGPGAAGDARFGPAAVHLLLTATPTGVLATGEVSAEARLECSRCLSELKAQVEGRFEHVFSQEAATTETKAPRSRRAGEAGEGAAEDDAAEEDESDVSPIIDGAIDIEPMINEVLILGLPMKPLCRSDCRGLCPSCGRSLEQGDCECQVDDIDPRMAVLGKFLRPDPSEGKSAQRGGRRKEKD